MRIASGVLVIVLGAISPWFYLFLISLVFEGFFAPPVFIPWFALIIPSIVCCVFIFKARFWVACLVISVLFGGVIPAIFIVLGRKDWEKEASVKKGISILLAVLSIIAFTVLAALYYGVFIVQWGNTAPTIKWGLPVAVISAFALGAGILALRRANWKWGIAGICVAIIAIPYTNILLDQYSYVLLPQRIQNNNSLSREHEIIKQLIIAEASSTKGLDNGSYIVVKPDTDLSDTFILSELDSSLSAKITELSNKYGYDFMALYTQFIENNQKQVQIQINSSIVDGYYIDYDNIFSRLNNKDYYGVQSWRTLSPQIVEYLSLSFPAFDPESGYFITCIGRHDIYSQFDISIYRYLNLDGKLHLLEYLISYIVGPPTP